MTDPSKEHDSQSNTGYIERFTHSFVFLWVGALTVTLFVDPVAAAESSQPIMTTVENATAWLTGIGPAVGTLNAGFNMMKASGTNKSGKKKEYKENIRSFAHVRLGARHAHGHHVPHHQMDRRRSVTTR